VQGFIDMQEASSPEQNDPKEQADNGETYTIIPFLQAQNTEYIKHQVTIYQCRRSSSVTLKLSTPCIVWSMYSIYFTNQMHNTLTFINNTSELVQINRHVSLSLSVLKTLLLSYCEVCSIWILKWILSNQQKLNSLTTPPTNLTCYNILVMHCNWQ
jgi:hypothetical protein